MKNSSIIYIAIGIFIILMGLNTHFVIKAIRANRELVKHTLEIEKTNQAYNKAMVCIVSVPPPRDPNYVKDCYDQAEIAVGSKLQRYGDAR